MVNPFKDCSLSQKDFATDMTRATMIDLHDLEGDIVTLRVKSSDGVARNTRAVDAAGVSIFSAGVLLALGAGTTAAVVHAMVIS